MTYIISIATLILIYAMLAASLSLLVGHTGIFSLAHAALFGTGAYTAAILTVTYGWNFVPAFGAAIIVSAALSAAMSIPSLRVSGDYFIVASLAMQTILGSIATNWQQVTGGPAGLPGLYRPVLGPINLGGNAAYLVFVLLVATTAIALCIWLVRSPFGRMLHAVRDDELVAATLGKPVRRAKILVTIFSGAIAGVAGVLYAHYLLYINPSSFILATSILVMTMVIIGGMNSIIGTVVGAGLIILLPEALRALALPAAVAASLQQIIFGALLILFMFLRPQGLLGGQWSVPGTKILGRRSQKTEETDAIDA